MGSKQEPDTESHFHDLEGGPLISDIAQDPSSLRQCHKVEGAFLEYFVEKLLPRFYADLTSRGMTPIDEERLRRLIRVEFQSVVIEKTGEAFRAWFDSNAHGITQRVFETYAVGNWPESIFREIFPDISIEDFLDECFNEVTERFHGEVAARQSFIRESAQSATNCLPSGTND
jgi:hypothetical protein